MGARRVLHCIPGMGGGGAERQLTYLAGGLGELGWEVHVAITSRGPNFEQLRATGAVVHEVGGGGNHNPGVVWRLMGAMVTVRPSLVQTWLPQMDVFGGIAARARGVPWVLSERASRSAYPFGVKRWARRVVATCAAAVISNSDAGQAYWRDQIGSGVPQYVILNAVPVAEIDAVEAAPASDLGVDGDARIVLSAGRFEFQKNLETLVSALGQVMTDSRVVTILCGHGPLRVQMERQVREAGLAGRVRLPGYVPFLWRWMKRAEVFVSVSTFEGRPNTVLEAMACGCPLVVSDIPEHREFLDEETAVFVDPRQPHAIAWGIASVLSSPQDAARRAERARASVEKWAIPAIAREYDRVYEEILARMGAAGRQRG